MKTLIAAPIGGWKQYSLQDWLDWANKQSCPDTELALCINGKDQVAVGEKISEMTTKKNLHFLYLPDSEEMTMIQKITYSREMIRRYAISEGYDYLFFLDTDTIPAFLNSIQQLMSRNKEVISGLYFYKNTRQPVVIDAETNTNISIEKCMKLVDKDEVIEVWGFGFGCLLLSRSVFEKYSFDYELFGEERSDDFGYCHVLEQNGVKRWFDPVVICKHLNDPEAKTGQGTKLPFMIKNDKDYKD